jgi:hypothetical protein
LDSRRKRIGPRHQRIWRMFWAQLQLQYRVRDVRSFVELFAYGGRFSEFVRRMTSSTVQVPWGPRFPGIESVLENHSVIETCAIQWQECVSKARLACAALPSEQYREFRYEELIREPKTHVSRVLDFLELDSTGELSESLAAGVKSHQLPRWPEHLSSSLASQLEEHIGPTLTSLGYPLSGGPSRRLSPPETEDC